MPATKPRPPVLRVLIVDFNIVVRAGLEAILAKDATIELAGAAANIEEALTQLRTAAAHARPVSVVLTQTRTKALDGVELTRLVKQEFPTVAVLVLSEKANDTHVIDAIQAGAGGYIFLNEIAPAALLQSIHQSVQGGTQMQATLLRRAVDTLLENGRRTLAQQTTAAARLTGRDVDVLRLLGNGDSDKVIGERLTMTQVVVKQHVRSVIAKLHAGTRARAAIIAAQAGVVGNPILHLVPPALGAKL